MYTKDTQDIGAVSPFLYQELKVLVLPLCSQLDTSNKTIIYIGLLTLFKMLSQYFFANKKIIIVFKTLKFGYIT